jgi:hypothetical protein
LRKDLGLVSTSCCALLVLNGWSLICSTNIDSYLIIYTFFSAS